MVPAKAISFLMDAERFLVLTHINPDGDGLGSAMAMKCLLERLGKKAEIVIDSEPPEMFAFFTNYEWVRQYGVETDGLEPFNTVISVDAPTIERLGDAAKLIADDANILCIDHHVSAKNFADVNYIDGTASATAQMVYYLASELNIAITPETAEYLYTGIVIDTGRFRFSNTTPDVLHVAGELVKAGADPDKISRHLYYNNTLETTQALGKLLETIELHFNGKVATAHFTHAYMLGDHWKNVDTEGFVNHALSIRGVEVAMLLRETKTGITRVSLRAKGGFDVNELAKIFGGGGHAKAAGLTINEPLEKAKKILLDETERTLKAG
ncbi:FIG146085: 3'-to-5' oligoribonuclease A, Bacillus type [hydrothermal vent metagenome]|uniref:FIG146085: 3'-to-5' oligoribonuclease A, Bacillus type n=1 Tax=hydrothermal vent metagenome TaxID=652676 RepID=A0A3B1CUS6_9ZZZZ